jgi:mannose-6-phosphate isomerase-like protein (cupin superfamily)
MKVRKEQIVENTNRGATQVASGEGKTLWVLGDLYEFKATGEDTGGKFALWETTTPPGNPGPPPHIHHNEDEVFYILEGELELTVEGSASVVGVGTLVNIPKGALHTFRNAGTTPARFLGMVAPGGFEGFFEEVGEPAEDASSPPAGPPDVEKVMATAPKYGLEIPPPPGE